MGIISLSIKNTAELWGIFITFTNLYPCDNIRLSVRSFPHRYPILRFVAVLLLPSKTIYINILYLSEYILIFTVPTVNCSLQHFHFPVFLSPLRCSGKQQISCFAPCSVYCHGVGSIVTCSVIVFLFGVMKCTVTNSRITKFIECPLTTKITKSSSYKMFL